MRCRSRTLTLALSLLSLSSFIGGCVSKVPPPIDGYCERYNLVVQEKGDGESLRGVKPGPKRSIYANELTYRQHCPAKP